MIRYPDHSTGIADILATEVEDGEVRCNLGYYQGTADDQGIGASSPLWGQFGFASRPADTGAGACMACYLVNGDQKLIIATRDNRHVDKIGDLKPGGVSVYNQTGSFLTLDGATGTCTTYVPYAFDGDGVAQKAHAITVDVETDGSESINIVHGEGMAITMLAGGKNSVVIKNKAGDAYIEINDDGIVLNGNVKVNGGITLGDTTGALPLITAPALLTWVGQVNAAITSLATHVHAGVTSGGASTAVPTVPPVTPAAVPLATTKTSGF